VKLKINSDQSHLFNNLVSKPLTVYRDFKLKMDPGIARQKGLWGRRGDTEALLNFKRNYGSTVLKRGVLQSLHQKTAQ
jgi:hypothetical protein